MSKLLERLASRGVDIADQLDLAGVQLALDPVAYVFEAVERRRGASGQPPGNRIDQEQLLLDPQRVRLTRPEALLAIGRRGHAAEYSRDPRLSAPGTRAPRVRDRIALRTVT